MNLDFCLFFSWSFIEIYTNNNNATVWMNECETRFRRHQYSFGLFKSNQIKSVEEDNNNDDDYDDGKKERKK